MGYLHGLNFCQGPCDVAVFAFLPVTQAASVAGGARTLVSHREKKQGARAPLLCLLGGSRGVTAAYVPFARPGVLDQLNL